jgi:ribonuclease VapC
MSGVVVDTSAAVAVLTGEPAGGAIIEILDQANRRLMSAASFVELGIVLEARFGPVGGAVADRFIREASIEVAPLDLGQAHAAIGAWRRYGKGRHVAGLNFGDCFTYALAATTQHPVACLGDDFTQTDLMIAASRS